MTKTLRKPFLFTAGLLSVAVGLMLPPNQTARGQSAAPAAKAAASEKPAGRKVFYATHSLQWDTPNPVVELAKAAGIQGHELVGVQRNGFSTATQIWNAGAQ